MPSSTPKPRAENVSGTVAPCSLNVHSPEGTTIFLRALLKFKRCFSGNDHSDGETGVQRELAKQGIEVSLSEIKKKRRNLLNQFRRMQKKENVLWEYYIPCAVLCNDPNFPETKLRGTEFDYWEGDKPRACLNKVPEYDSLTFRKVAVWPTQYVDELIALRKQFWQEFQKPENHSFLWRRVGECLYKKDRRMIYSGQQCENKWDALRKTYKDLKQKVQKSGAEGAPKITTSWPHFSDMDELLCNDVTVEPPVTIALGSTHEMHTPDLTPDRVGKTRPSTLPRTSPDERGAGLLEIAKEMRERTKVMKERNELLAKMHSTSVVSNDMYCKEVCCFDGFP